MAKGHGIILNLTTYLPYIFDANPTEVETKKSINYFLAPNIGGSHHEMYFTGFDNKEVTFSFVSLDMENPMGVTGAIAFFEALREPAPSLTQIAAMISGNENFPPPLVLFTFGTGSLIPLVYKVLDVQIVTSLFHDGHIRGVVGIPKRADISITLALDENNVLNKANLIAKKVAEIAGSAESVVKEVVHKTRGGRKEQLGIWPSNVGGNW